MLSCLLVLNVFCSYCQAEITPVMLCIFSWVGYNSLVCVNLGVMASAAEPHLNATFAQHLALKVVYEKSNG